MKLIETEIPGCYEIQLNILPDERGYFVKTFHQNLFREQGLIDHFAEAYYSFSKQNVLRGLHFQTPPQDHAKLVHCAQGTILDAVVDLRTQSPTYKQHLLIQLSAEKGNQLYIPPGLAHGFYITSETALVMYQVSTVYAPEQERGILWNTANIPWPKDQPLVSQKDQKWSSLADFVSPFKDPL